MTFQFNVPNSTPPIMLPEGVEVWTTNGNAIVTFTGLPFEAIRVSLGTLPPGIAFTIQGVLFVFHPVPGFGCLGATTSLVGTPALWFQN